MALCEWHEQEPAYHLTLRIKIKQKEFTGQVQAQPKHYPDAGGARLRPGPALTCCLHSQRGAQIRRVLASRRFHCGKQALRMLYCLSLHGGSSTASKGSLFPATLITQ